jgi:hypothetical protein
MKSSSSTLLAILAAPLASAFPAHVFEAVNSNPELAARANEIMARQTGANAAQAIFEPVPIFDAQAQRIDISAASGHEFRAPDFSKGDLRGPCPGVSWFDQNANRIC